MDRPARVLGSSRASGRGGSSQEPSDPAGSGGGAGRGSKVVGHPASDKRTPRQMHPRTYTSWRAMRQRCRDQGFVLDPRWRSFENFLADMGPRPPGGKYTLDRADPADRRYGPGLCRWVSKKGQTRNRQNTVYLTDDDGTCRALGEWAELRGVSPDTLRKRRERGWSDPEVIHGKLRGRPGPNTWGREDDGALIDSLPYPVEGSKNKLYWEIQFRVRSMPDEGRVNFFLRKAKLWREGALQEQERDRREGLEDDPVLVRKLSRVHAAIARAESILIEQQKSRHRRRENESAKLRVRDMLKRPGNLGTDGEWRLDALLRGLAD